jgi:protein transport protein SEC23
MILFTGGAVTVGPGQIVSEKKAEILRSHLDIQKGNANTKNIVKATKFFESIAEDASNLSAVIDLFSKRFN